MPITHVICVGAIYLDTILTVPHFPAEDTKLRATNLSRRRGGNTANTLEVLTQLVTPSTHRLYLLSVLPDITSDATGFVKDSLLDVDLDKYGVFKEGQQDAASSFIIKSEETGSRTIVSHNQIGEMTFQEFKDKIGGLDELGEEGDKVWVHFEGRIPDVTLQCVRYLRELERKSKRRIMISLECEKPERAGLKDVVGMVDLVVYSKLWAESNGYKSAQLCLESQIEAARRNALFCCTWGSEGAFAMKKKPNSHNSIGHWTDAWRPKSRLNLRTIDAIGAGDTFIAGLIYTMTSKPRCGLEHNLDFANELAGRKVYQEGFSDLGKEMKAYKEKFDELCEDNEDDDMDI